jgi:hypothetical protein
MVTIRRMLKDGTGKQFDVVMEIDEGGDKLDGALAQLANRARHSKSGTATALGGAVRVRVAQR